MSNAVGSPYDCNCKNFNSFDHFEQSVHDIARFASNAMKLLGCKELLKLLLLLFSCCCTTLQSPRWFQLVLNTPFSLFLMAVPAYRNRALQTKLALDSSKQFQFNVVLDFLTEDILGLVVPCWFMYFAEPTATQIFSLYITCFSMGLQVIVVIDSMLFSGRCLSSPAGNEEEKEVADGIALNTVSVQLKKRSEEEEE